jgi:phosphoribosylformylglycinamidine cyclo-ligase
MAGFYEEGEYDLAGFVVGIADNDDLLDGSEIAVGHSLIGIGSSGIHSNGYSLVRKIFFEDLKMTVGDYVEDFGRTLGEELLEPTKIYSRTIINLKRNFRISGISHITGGGLIDNIPRILPKQCKAVINKSSWIPHAIFSFIQTAARITDHEMMRTFNNGLGLVIIVNEKDAAEIVSRLNSMGETAYIIGSVQSREKDEEAVQFEN